MSEDRKALWRTALIGSFWQHKSTPGRTYKVLGLSFDRPALDDPELTGRLTLGHNAGDFTGVHARYSYKQLKEEFTQVVQPEGYKDVAPNTSIEVATGKVSSEPRKPIQIATGSVSYGPLQGTLIVFALANDGTMWRYNANSIEPEWKQMPALPQPEGEK